MSICIVYMHALQKNSLISTFDRYPRENIARDISIQQCIVTPLWHTKIKKVTVLGIIVHFGLKPRPVCACLAKLDCTLA